MGSSKVKKDRAGLAVVARAEGAVEPSSTEAGGGLPNENPTTTAAPVTGSAGAASARPPDPEVPERPSRRQFSAAYKLRILQEADRCRDTRGIGSLLRREGLYSSHLSKWRQQREEGSLSALSPRTRGRPAEKPHPDTLRLALSERKLKHVERRLKQAEALLELQKKVSEILGIDLPPAPSSEDE
jgi:transposase-like protein